MTSYKSIKRKVKQSLSVKNLDRIKYIRRSANRYKLFASTPFRYSKGLDNIYHACIQRAGSQWIKSIFSDKRVRNLTGLSVHPQFNYDSGEFKFSFPKYTFVPCLYISYDLYDLIQKPSNYKTLYILRDPRDLIVSWYYSTKYTHNISGRVAERRRYLNSVTRSKGLEYAIKRWQLKLSKVREWWINKNDNDIKLVKFEDITNDPEEVFFNIFTEWGYEISKNTVSQILSDYTKEKMRERDISGRRGERSKYRENKVGWEEMFEVKHRDLFKRLNGNLVEDLGYKPW
jgi:hypothetical protein